MNKLIQSHNVELIDVDIIIGPTLNTVVQMMLQAIDLPQVGDVINIETAHYGKMKVKVLCREFFYYKDEDKAIESKIDQVVLTVGGV